MSYNKKRKRNEYAQRKYEITKFNVNNLLRPDELTMSFKRNYLVGIGPGGTVRNEYFIFGSYYSDLTAFENWTEMSQQYKQVEFLSGSLTMYVFNNVVGVTEDGDGTNHPTSTQAVLAYKTMRQWRDENGDNETESGMGQIPQGKLGLWNTVSERPGVSMKFVQSGATGQPNMQKLKWTANQHSFNRLKADRTGFQVNRETMEFGERYPHNSMIVDLAFNADAIDIGKENYGAIQVYVSQKIWVRFKGRMVA